LISAILRHLWRLVRGVIRILLALLILFEQWGWDPLARLMSRIGQLPLFHQFEALIKRLPPYAALVVFFVPGLSLLPIKLLALWAIGEGHAGLGLAVIVAAKVLGTAIVARLFQLTQPALMRLAWFARWYARWLAWKARLLAWARRSTTWRSARAIKLRVRRFFRRRPT